MQVIKEIKAIRLELKRFNDKKIAFVPTMGNLHDGHLQLVYEAKKIADIVVVSIFVNQKQFNNSNDFAKYPRTLEADLAKLKAIGADFIFAPNHQEIYPDEPTFQIIPDKNLSDCLCGKTRVGHMEGVCLVVAKLFNIVKPDFALFGKKDFQQYLIIKKMVEELNFDIEIIGVETIREKSGLAMSSRNNLLSEEEKLIAANIYKVLNEIKSQVHSLANGPRHEDGVTTQGQSSARDQSSTQDQPSAQNLNSIFPIVTPSHDGVHNNLNQNLDLESLLKTKKQKLLKLGFNKIDYLEIHEEKNLNLIKNFNELTIEKSYRIFVAAFLGEVRLIDNLII